MSEFRTIINHRLGKADNELEKIMKVINQNGINQVREFLVSHKAFNNAKWTDSEIRRFLIDCEFEPHIEVLETIKEEDGGYTQIPRFIKFEISESDFDAVESIPDVQFD